MFNSLPRLALLGLLSFAVPAASCSGTAEIDINARITVTTSVDVNNVRAGQAVPMTVQVTNITLVEPTATPPPGQEANAGHLRVYLDDTDDDELLITAQTSFSVTIPANTSPGAHRIICRVHRHDGAPTTTTFQLNIVVRATVIDGD